MAPENDDTPTVQMRRYSDRSVTSALDKLAPWKRNTLFLLGAIVFLMPVVDHIVNEVIRGHDERMSVLHLMGDSIFLFAGVLGMVPQLAIRVLDHLAVWRGIGKKP